HRARPGSSVRRGCRRRSWRVSSARSPGTGGTEDIRPSPAAFKVARSRSSRSGSLIVPHAASLWRMVMVVRPPRQIRPSTIATLVLAVAVPTALFAQEGGGDVSRTPDGRILHRRSPEPGETAVADTPVFVYEPGG